MIKLCKISYVKIHPLVTYHMPDINKFVVYKVNVIVNNESLVIISIMFTPKIKVNSQINKFFTQIHACIEIACTNDVGRCNGKHVARIRSLTHSHLAFFACTSCHSKLIASCARSRLLFEHWLTQQLAN